MHEMQHTDPNHTPNPFEKLFGVAEPLRDRIIAAAGYLRLALDLPPANPEMLMAWSEILTCFDSKQLAQAFNVASLTVASWPKPADIAQQLFEQEFAADYAWIIQNLKLHKVEWKDREPLYSESRTEFYEDENGKPARRERVREILKPAIPAPAIPARIKRALEIYGANGLTSGLRMLYNHPEIGGSFGPDPLSSTELVRLKGDIDRGFRAAWMQARRESLGGAQ